jgi:GTP cyclohydrolase II
MGKGHLLHGFRVEADRRFQREFAGGDIGQIERAVVRIEALGDEFDDIAQGLAEAVRSRDDLGDIGQQRDAVRNGGSPTGVYPSSDAAMVPKSGVIQGNRGFPRRAEVFARRLTALGRSERGRVGLQRPVGGREHLVLVFEAQSECEQDLPLRIHPAVHALFDTVDRPKRDFRFARKLGLGHQTIFAQFSNSILSNRVRFINFHNALLALQICSEASRS